MDDPYNIFLSLVFILILINFLSIKIDHELDYNNLINVIDFILFTLNFKYLVKLILLY